MKITIRFLLLSIMLTVFAVLAICLAVSWFAGHSLISTAAYEMRSNKHVSDQIQVNVFSQIFQCMALCEGKLLHGKDTFERVLFKLETNDLSWIVLSNSLYRSWYPCGEFKFLNCADSAGGNFLDFMPLRDKYLSVNALAQPNNGVIAWLVTENFSSERYVFLEGALLHSSQLDDALK